MLRMNEERRRSRCYLLDIPVDDLTVSELNHRILDLVRKQRHALVLNVNVHAMNLAVERPWFADMLRAAEIVFCDGAGVRLAAFLRGRRLPPRITYADWMWSLAEFASAHGLSVFFLGGRPGVAAQAADALQRKYPTLKVVGVRHGYFEKTVDSPESNEVVEEVNKSSA